MSAPVKTVVIGVGHLGRHHARLLAETPGAELVGVVDTRAAQAKEIADGLGVTAYEHIDELPDDVGAASVAVTTSAHHDVVCALLERDVHVLVEKPIAADLDEARRMTELAGSRGLVLQVGHVERFNPALTALADLDITPRFLEVHRLAPFNFRALDVSVVMDLMIHDLDIVLDMAGAPLERIDAVGSPVLGRHVDLCNARLQFENGCVANVTASRVSFEPLRRTRVFSEDTFVSLDFGTRRAFVATRAEGFDLGSLSAVSAETHPPRDSFREFVEQGILDVRELEMDGDVNPLHQELTEFISTVRGERPERPRAASAADGLRALEVATRISDRIAEHPWT